MKHAMAVLLVLSLLLACLSGCGGEQTAPESPQTPSAAENNPGGETAPDPTAGEADSAPEEEAYEEEEAEEAFDNDWAFDLPGNHGMDADLLAALHEAADQTNINSIVIVKDGVIVDEYYGEGYDEESVFRLASCSKSFSGSLIGIAIDQGLLRDVDEPLANYFEQIAESDDPLKQAITIEHLLTHTSGIYWSEWSGGTMFGELARSDNWVEFVLGQPMASQPGTTFNYTTGGSHMIAAVLEQAIGRSAADFAEEYLFAPLGMDSVQWRTDPQGVTDGGNGISMTARDAAKFGQLYLDGGAWRGRRIISEEWVSRSTSQQASGAGSSGAYGYQWWIRPFGANNYDSYYAMGHGGQFIFVVPELELVCVMTSNFQDTYAPWPYFTDYVLAACG